MIRNYWRILSPFHSTFGWFIFLIIIYEALQIIEGYSLSLAIRLYGVQAEFWVIALFIVGLLFYDAFFMWLDGQVDWHIIAKQNYPIYKYLKLAAIAKFLKLDIPWHQSHNSGTLVGKVSHGVDKVNDIVQGMSWEFVPTIIQTVLSFIPLLILSPFASVVSLISFTAFMWVTFKAHKKTKPYREERHDAYEIEWQRSIEIVQAIETNIMFGQSDRLLKEQEQLHNRIMNLGMDESRLIIGINRWRIGILCVARRTILGIWLWQLMYAGTLDVPNLFFVSILSEKLFHSFWRFARLFDRAAEASEGAGRLAKLINESDRIIDSGKVPQLESPIGIEMKDVCFAYSNEYTRSEGALHDFNLQVDPGTVVALVGPSGAGKTTIRKVVTGLFKIQEGVIKVGGIDITDWSESALLKLFSYVPQGDDVFIFNGTIKDNIMFPKPKATNDEVINAAILAGIHDFIEGLAEGYDTKVGERGKRLSGGQKQRVALARAILADRPILILDEATSAVDAITEAEIQQKMRKILKGKTAIIIAHRLSTIWDISDKIVVMDHGRKVEEGSHAELMKLNGLYAHMVVLQTAE